MNTRLRIALVPVLAVVACFLASRPATAHDRVQAICVIAADIDACVPQDG